MPDWDEDSPQLRENLSKVLRDIRRGAKRRDVLTLDSARQWQRDTMYGLKVPKPEYVGHYRGEIGIRNVQVWVGTSKGVTPIRVAEQLKMFEGRLQRTLNALDKLYAPGKELDTDGLSAVIDLAAWAHSEWVRIHPFANGNGRTARMWANAVFMRYGLDPVVRLRPRPENGYGAAGARAMNGDWQSTAVIFRKMLLDPS